MEELVMGRTIPSWRIVVDQEIAVMSRFKQFLRPDERAVFVDLLSQCKLYAGGWSPRLSCQGSAATIIDDLRAAQTACGT